MYKTVLIFLAILFSMQAKAWKVTSGKVGSVNVYSTTSTILIKLVDHAGNLAKGADVADCTNKDTFAISGSLPADRRSQLYSALLMAKASGRAVSFAYSSGGGCVAYGPNKSVYREIKRIIF